MSMRFFVLEHEVVWQVWVVLVQQPWSYNLRWRPGPPGEKRAGGSRGARLLYKAARPRGYEAEVARSPANRNFGCPRPLSTNLPMHAAT
jgi:hypothetical protein